MDKSERVVLTDAFPWQDETGERLFAAGAHTLPAAIAQAARSAGLVAADVAVAEECAAEEAPPADGADASEADAGKGDDAAKAAQ